MKAFKEAKLMGLVTFDHRRIYKKEVVQFYLNATISSDGSIKSKVGDVDVTITIKDIREEFDLEEASNLDVTSHAFNQKKFWDEIQKDDVAQYVKFSGKKKDLLKAEWERAIDIVYKCLESKVARIDEITPKKINVLSVIMNNYNYNWARHVFNYLGTFILKAIKPGSSTISIC